MASHILKLVNEMTNHEQSCDVNVPNSVYFVVSVKLYNVKNINLESLAKYCLTLPELKPTSVFINLDTFLLVFKNSEKHPFNGSHVKIASYLSSEITGFMFEKYPKLRCTCSIYEFASKIKTFSYLITQNYILFGKVLNKLSNDKIKESEALSLTFGECVDKLKSFGVDWNTLPNKDKYGIWFKEGGKKGIQTFSEHLDFMNFEKQASIID